MPDSAAHVTITPMLSVRRGAEAVTFYKKAFGAEVADESPEHQNYSPESLNGSTTRLVLVVADPAAVHAQALAAGATEIWPVRKANGWFIGRVVDPFGHHWEIGKPLSAGVGQ